MGVAGSFDLREELGEDTGLVRVKQTQAESNSSRRRRCFSSLKVCKVGHNENPSSLSYSKKPHAKRHSMPCSNPFKMSGSNLFNERMKINPKTKSYSGGGAGKEAAPKISITTLPFTPAAAVGWVALHQRDLAGQEI